ncbi:hypothetical protein BGZ49_010784 [Haplosporangium sp. Z 27]|nr:hypothetical protein BGZ49_010784 [Haplosporangium sp. Z 27]
MSKRSTRLQNKLALQSHSSASTVSSQSVNPKAFQEHSIILEYEHSATQYPHSKSPSIVQAPDRLSNETLVTTTSTSVPLPAILVQGSEDEAEVNIKATNNSRVVRRDIEDSIELSCVGSYPSVIEPRSRRPTNDTDGIQRFDSNANAIAHSMTIEVPDSEDEGQSTTLNGVNDNLQSLSISGSLVSSLQESLDLLDKVQTGTPLRPETITNEGTSYAATSHYGYPDKTEPEPSTTFQTLQHPFVFRSYPLRERTFQQRKPYTADKQQHARLIGNRGSSSRSLQSRESYLGDTGLIDQQDDEDDADYEEQDSSSVNAKIRSASRTKSHETLSGIATINGDFHFQDLDEDDLPTIEDLRRQFQSHERISSSPEINAPLTKSSQVKLLPTLSVRAKRRLERLALLEVEALDPVDMDPIVPDMEASPLSNSRSSFGTTRSTQNLSSEESPYISEAPAVYRIDRGSEDDREMSGEGGAKVSTTTKIPKRPRQHVLPMAFFKRNLLPDDAAALKSMRSRSKSNRSRMLETGSTPELDHTKLAHHATRRIAPLKQGDSLGDFMAKLGQDKSASDGESSSNESFLSDPHDYYESLQSNDWGSRPTLKDTEPFKDHSPYPAHNHGYQWKAPSYSASSDSDRLEPQDNEDDYYKPVLENTTFNTYSRAMSKASSVRGERLDMIDRMTVRSSKTSVPKRHTFAPSSRKRRRLSGNMTSVRIPRSISSSRALPGSSKSYALNLDLESDSASSGDFQRDFSGGTHKRRAARNSSGNYSFEHQSTYEDAGHDMYDYSIHNNLSDFESREPHKSAVELEYPILRYDNTISKPRPRFLSRPKIIPVTRKPKLTRPSPNTKRSSHGQSRPRTSKMLLQATLYPHLVGQNLHDTTPHRPQFVNRPAFKAASRITEPQGSTNREQFSAHQERRISQTSIDDCTLIHQDEGSGAGTHPGQELLSEHETIAQPISVILNRLVSESHDSAFSVETTAIISNGTIPNGIYFSRDTYIGRGLLSQLLRSMSIKPSDVVANPGYKSSAVFFGQSFLPGWDDFSRVEHDLGLVVLDWKQRLRSIQELLQSRSASDFRGGTYAPTEITANLLALENMTILLIERFTISPLQSSIFWKVFRSEVVIPLEKLAEESLPEQEQPVISVLLLWVRWAIVTWSILAACMLPEEREFVDNRVQVLLRQLLEASNAEFVIKLSRLVGPKQVSQSVIYGQDVVEIWVCIIQILNRYSELHSNKQDFWSLFNRQVLQMWLSDRNQVAAKGVMGETSVSVKEWQGRANHVFGLLRELCKLHQFGRDGSSNSAVLVGDNWELIVWLLQNNWLNGEQQETVDSEIQLREFLVFCHSRIYDWSWIPSSHVIVHIYRYFANRRFRDMPTEHGYRLPEFLKNMTTAPHRRQGQSESQHINDMQPQTVFSLNLPLLETVDRYDRCFEIFLKILAKTVNWHVCSIIDDNDTTNAFSTPNMNSQADSNDGLANQAVSYQMLSKSEKIKACKRLLSSISPVFVATISSTSLSEQTYSSLCNPCNLVLIVALLVPDFIRPSTVGQLRSLLNFEESDDVSRRILLESMFYLGTIWQRQSEYSVASEKSTRSIQTMLDYIFDKLEFLCQVLENEIAAIHNSNGTEYVPRSKRHTPVAALIETTLGYITRLMCNEANLNQDQVAYPSVAYLDQRISRFFNPEIGYPSELRLQALGIIERFLTLRESYESQLRNPRTKQSSAHPNLPVNLNAATAGQYQDKDVDDGFSSLDYDQLEFLDNDFFDSSQQTETVDLPNATSTTTTSTLSCVPVILPHDDELASALMSWIFPSLVILIKARHQALHDEQIQQSRSTIPGNLIQSLNNSTSPFATTSGRRGFFADSSNPTRQSNFASISSQGASRILGVYADCSMILLAHGRKKMDEITELFKREPWLSPWIQHWRQQDELIWATRMIQSSPKSLLTNEDIFLSIWFRTICIPIHELTVQHRYLMAILKVMDSGEISVSQLENSSPLLCHHLFKDLPIAHRDYNSVTESAMQFADDMNVDISLLDTNKESRLFQEFKESRMQVVAKALSNIGEHYLVVRPAAGSVDQTTFYRAQSVKSRYQSYLNLLMNQIKRDYERLELKNMVRESIKHVEIAHHVLGHVIQHCGLVMQNSQLTGSNDSILNYLTSSRHFPQPRMDGIYIHQKIRGYAYLYQAGEKQFFCDMLGLILGHLKLIPGANRLRFKWPIRQEYATSARPTSTPKDDESLYLRVTDYGHTVYEYDDGKLSDTVTPGKLHLQVASDNSSTATRATPGTISRLFAIQSDKSQPQEGSADTRSSENIGVPSASNSPRVASGNTTKLSIQTLFANQAVKQRGLSQRSIEALRTLTSSLRNVALEAEDRKQWNSVMSSFRTMVYIAIFRPLLTAFLGPDSRKGYCSSRLQADAEDGINRTYPVIQNLPLRPSLMIISVPAAQWVVSLIKALAIDISDLDTQMSARPLPEAFNSEVSLEGNSMLLALEGFQKETSMLFSSLLQCLIGCFDLIDTRWLECVKTRLGSVNLRDNDTDSAFNDNDASIRALYLFGQVLQAIEAIAKVARKIRLEHASFYEKNESWREALLDLIQVALDHGLFLMMSLGGPVEERQSSETDDTDEEQIPPGGSSYSNFLARMVLDQPSTEDRISGSQDIVSMEASFLEFSSGHTQFTLFEKQVYRELQNISSVESWSGDVLSSGASETSTNDGAAARATGQQRQENLELEMEQRLPRRHWVLWSFQSSFFDYCESISALDGRFHRQVQRAVERLLKSSSFAFHTPDGKVIQNEDSVWCRILNNITNPTSGGTSTQPWAILRWCLGREWQLFQTERGDFGSDRYESDPTRNHIPMRPGVTEDLLSLIPGVDSLFV